MRKIIAIVMLAIVCGGCVSKVEVEPELQKEPMGIDIEDYQGIWYCPNNMAMAGVVDEPLIISGNKCTSPYFEEREIDANAVWENAVCEWGDGWSVSFADGEIMAICGERSGAVFTKRYTEQEHEINKIAVAYVNAMRDGEWDEVSDRSVIPLSEPDKDIFKEVVVSEVSLELRSVGEDIYCYDFIFEVDEPGRTVYRAGKNERYLWVEDKDGEWKIELTTGL